MNILGTMLKRNLEQKLSRKKYQSILEESFDGFLTTGSDTKITYSGPSTFELTGMNEEQLRDLPITSLLHPEDTATFQRQCTEMIRDQKLVLTTRKRLKTGDGVYTWVEIRMRNLLSVNDVKCIVYFFTVITQLIDRERQQEDFVNIASHELKNPISAIHGYLQLVKRRTPEINQDLHKVITRMSAQLNKMQDIVNAMLNNTMIKSGEIKYNFDPFNLNDCIRDTVDAIKINNDSHEINCNFESPDRKISGDEEKISRVLTNLISNAIKYSPEGKTVELTTILEPGFIKVIITDHGIGIAKEKQAHLFQRFYRVDTLPKRLSGLGLGLFIAADIIRHHYGAIGLESVVGNGASFWFTLPLADQH